MKPADVILRGGGRQFRNRNQCCECRWGGGKESGWSRGGDEGFDEVFHCLKLNQYRMPAIIIEG